MWHECHNCDWNYMSSKCDSNITASEACPSLSCTRASEIVFFLGRLSSSKQSLSMQRVPKGLEVVPTQWLKWFDCIWNKLHLAWAFSPYDHMIILSSLFLMHPFAMIHDYFITEHLRLVQFIILRSDLDSAMAADDVSICFDAKHDWHPFQQADARPRDIEVS